MTKLSNLFNFLYRCGLMLILFLLIQLPPVAISIANRHPSNLTLTIILMVIFLILFVFIISWSHQLYRHYTQLSVQHNLRPGMVFGGYLVLLAGMMVLGRLNLVFFHQTETANNQAIAAMLDRNQLATIVFVISACTLTPIAEELIFRGVLTNLFWRVDRFWPKVILSGIIFSCAHISSNIISFLTYCFMGMVLAYIYRRSGDLHNSIALHALNNIVAIAMLLKV